MSSIYESDLYKRIRREVDEIKIIDTHEHLMYPRQMQGDIDFGRLFMHYASADVISVGMPVDDLENVRCRNTDSGWSVRKKWEVIKPYYERTWNTGYCECIRIAIRDIYGIDDLRDDTVELLSEKMNAVPRETWTREVFDKAGIEMAMQIMLPDSPVFERGRYPWLFIHDMVEQFSGLVIEPLAQDSGIEVKNLEDYLRVIDWYFDNFAQEAGAFKIGRAYDRSLLFEDVPASDASRIFDEMLGPGDPPAEQDVRALEDFIVHYCLAKSGEYDLPVKVHTGLQEGNGNDITNSRAALMINLFMKYPKTKFDIFHISWPYAEELTCICKNFPNVFIDFCWAWAFNPPAARRYLSDMLETVPFSKIHGFGGDYMFVEGSYGHSVIARREIARVMAEKVEDGRFSEDYAVRAAQCMLRDNVLENFRLEEKQNQVLLRAREEQEASVPVA